MLRARLILLGCIFLCGCATQSSDGPQRPLPVAINKDAGRGNLLFVMVRLGRGKEVPFLVDTGSSGTLLDKSLAPKLGKRVGTIKARSWGVISELDVYAAPKVYLKGTRLITPDRMATYDFSHLKLETGEPVMGMLSIDCLKHYCIQLDFTAGLMRFLDPNDAALEKPGKAFPITFRDGGRPFINHVSFTGGQSTNCLIDSGFDVDGRVDGGTNRGRVHLKDCVWDGDSYEQLIVGQGTNANLLGLRFLARHLVTLDFPNRTMYLDRRSTGPLSKF